MAEKEALVHRLDYYYDLVSAQILQHQSLAHGLFPLNVNDKTHTEGHVRDNVYCAMSVWAVGLAYRHIDDDDGRIHELEQSAVKCMRGILFFYMRQAHKVEKFKTDQQPAHALHCKFDVNTADVFCENEKHNLQIDVVALYLLALVQMITSGLSIIFTSDEVNFIQNLVYYIERTYRIADYGMWGRGTRYNNGNRELQASSIGMVKAALEAINGFNMFGNKGTLSSVIYVDPDAHFRNSSTLHALLPRESNSKTTDAALLTIIGFPGFSINDRALRNETKLRVVKELSGRFGMKRFIRDGYGTVLEDKTKEYYQKADLKQFEKIESEWPMFFVYLALEAIFSGDDSGGGYLNQLESLLTYTKHGKTIPKYFYVASADIALERKTPGEAVRWPNDDLDDTFLWGQSLLIIASMLSEKLISVSELDPLGRSSYAKAKYKFSRMASHRYSSFQVGGSDLVVQVCLISEDRTLQANLATYGIETQTPKEIEPIVICPPRDLVRVYEELGKNNKLKLSGRPKRPLGSLGTSKMYRILGKTVVTYPIIIEEKDFYMSLDMSLMISDLKNSLAYISKSWNMLGRPTLCLFLRDHNFRGLHSSEMVDFMAQFKNGEVNGVKVKLGKMQTLMSTGCVEHLDYLKRQHCAYISVITNKDESQFLTPSGFESVYHPISSPPYECEEEKEHAIHTLNTFEIVQIYGRVQNLKTRMMLLQEVKQREGAAYSINDTSVEDCINEVYLQACYVHNWSVVRRGASLLGKTVASLAPSITSMLVSGKQVSFGVFGQQEHVINEPLTPAAIVQIIYQVCMPHDPREVSLQQEMVIYLASVVATKPHLFTGMLKIRVGWIIEAMKNRLLSCDFKEDGATPTKTAIYNLYPEQVRQLASATLAGRGSFKNCDITPKNMFEKRSLEGALNKVPNGFYERVWDILQRVPGLIYKKHTLPQEPVLTEMTVDETAFKLRVEDMLLEAIHPQDRQILVELIMVISTILNRNPELQLQSHINLGYLIDDAIKMFMTDKPDQAREDFFMLEQTIQGGTMTYLARSVVNSVLNDSLVLHGEAEKQCLIS